MSAYSIPNLRFVVITIYKIFARFRSFFHENYTIFQECIFSSLNTCLCLFLDYLKVETKSRHTRSEVIFREAKFINFHAAFSINYKDKDDLIHKKIYFLKVLFYHINIVLG